MNWPTRRLDGVASHGHDWPPGVETFHSHKLLMSTCITIPSSCRLQVLQTQTLTNANVLIGNSNNASKHVEIWYLFTLVANVFVVSVGILCEFQQDSASNRQSNRFGSKTHILRPYDSAALEELAVCLALTIEMKTMLRLTYEWSLSHRCSFINGLVEGERTLRAAVEVWINYVEHGMNWKWLAVDEATSTRNLAPSRIFFLTTLNSPI